jgi:stage V sporulation protein AE
MEYIKVFLVGGAICAIVQIFMEKTKLMPGRIMVLLVCFGSLLGALGIYKPFLEWAQAGASVPLIGFGNTLYEGVKNSIDSNGWIGLFKGGLSNTAVGISAALIFGYIGSLIYNPKINV